MRVRIVTITGSAPLDRSKTDVRRYRFYSVTRACFIFRLFVFFFRQIFSAAENPSLAAIRCFETEETVEFTRFLNLNKGTMCSIPSTSLCEDRKEEEKDNDGGNGKSRQQYRRGFRFRFDLTRMRRFTHRRESLRKMASRGCNNSIFLRFENIM